MFENPVLRECWVLRTSSMVIVSQSKHCRRLRCAQLFRRRERAGDIDPKHATLLLDRFELHMKYRFARLMVTDIVVETAAQMVDRHLLRAYDAVQLATCLELKKTVTERVVFVCSDEELLEAAKLERLSTLDPITPGP